MMFSPFVLRLPSLSLLLRLRVLVPVCVFCVGSLISVVVWQIYLDQVRARHLASFEFQASKVLRQLDAHMLATTQVLRGVVGLFAASREVEREEFRAYIAALRLGDRYPGIQGLGFARKLGSGELIAHQLKVRAEGYPHYQVHPEGGRPLYGAIEYLEPFDWRNQRAFGFDMYAEPVRREAMERARDTGAAALTGRVRLLQETEENVSAGVLVYVPVYRAGEGGSSPEKRRENLLGWAYAPLRMNDLMLGVFGREFPEFRRTMALALYTGQTLSDESLLFTSSSWRDVLPGAFNVRLPLNVAGQQWTLEARALSGFDGGANALHDRFLLLAGTFLSFMLALLSGFVLHSHARTSAALEDSAEAHRQLSQSQAELQSVFDTSGVGMLQVDTQGVVVRVNQRLAEMFACARENLAGSPYELLVPAQERDAVRQRINSLVESEQLELNLERRYCRADGSEFWGYLSARRLCDPSGKTIGLVGVVIDMSERREAERRLLDSEQRYRTLTDNLQDVVWTLDADSMRMIYCSPSIERLSGYPAEFALAAEIPPFLAGEDGQAFLARILDRAAGFESGAASFEQSFLEEIDLCSRQGGSVRVEISSCYARDAASGRLIVNCIARDIRERKRHEVEQKIAAVAFESHESMVVTDAHGLILRVNQAFSRLTGFSAAEVLGKSMRVVHSGRHDASFYEEMWKSIVSAGFWQGEVWNRHKSGQLYPVWLTITAVRDATGQTTHYVGSSFDISRQVQHQSEIRNLAFYDPLTGLANRRLFTDRLGHAFIKSGRSKVFGAVLYIDLDRFKEVNDTLGHGEGDRLLELVADRIATNVREGDTVARFGGDEFVVLLEDAGEEREEALAVVMAVAEKLRVALAVPYRLHGSRPGEWCCSSSIGVAVFRGAQENMESVLLRADKALYAAKDCGRNAVRLGEEGLLSEGETG